MYGHWKLKVHRIFTCHEVFFFWLFFKAISHGPWKNRYVDSVHPVGHSLQSLEFAVCCLLTILFISSTGKRKPRDRRWVSLITQWVSNRVILNHRSSPVPVLCWHSVCNPETAAPGQAIFTSHVEGHKSLFLLSYFALFLIYFLSCHHSNFSKTQRWPFHSSVWKLIKI